MSSKKVDWPEDFAPSYTPKEMLELGVFEGKYINNIDGIPNSWKKIDKVLGPDDEPDPEINYFGVKSRMSLSEWRRRGLIKTDKNGWFEWYIHFFLGRRLGDEDRWQIGRWKSFVARHSGQLLANCKPADYKCRPRQRQGLLQWAWDSRQAYTQEQVEKNLERIRARATKPKRSFQSESHLPVSWRW